MNQKRYKLYEEIAKQKGKQLFVESTPISVTTNDIEFCSVPLKESIGNSQYEALAIIKNVPISKYTENKNGRIYGRPLWERVHKNKMAEGTLCLEDHPDDDSDGSVGKIQGVWHNMKLGEDLVTMDLYLVEEKPVRVLKAGGKIGTSSVGFGQLSESDGKTVDPESFEVERAADLVMSPSQGTFATMENIQESIQTKANILTEDITNKTVNIDNKEQKISEEENKRNVNMIDKLKEAEYKDRTRGAIKAAKVATKLTEAIDDLKSFKDSVPEEMTECHTRIENTITELATKLEEQVASTHKSLQEKESTLEEISAKYSTLEKAHNQLKEDYNKVTKLVEQTKDGDLKKMTEEVKVLSKNCELMESDISLFKEEVSARDADIKCFVEDRKAMLEDIAVFKATVKKLKEALAKKSAKHGAKKGLKEDENEEFVDIDSFGDSDPIDSDFPAPEEDVLDIDIESGEVIDAEDDILPIDDFGYDDDLDAEALISEDTEATADEIEDEDLDGEEITEAEDDDEDEEKEDEEEDEGEEKKTAEKKSESTKIRVRKDVYKHYKEAVAKNPSIADIRKEVLSQKKLYDAVKLIEKFTEAKKAKNEMVSLKESSPYKVGAEKKYVFKRD